MEKIREFDLNIEKILENWEVYHAIREIIANALDEQILTRTKNIDIYQDDSSWWHIKDYGRGLNYHHLTQNENDEKLNNDKLIGRFGVGLKDALATLYRHNIKVKIKSKYGDITLKAASKVGFEDIITLHAEILPPENENMIGTDFCLFGCAADDIEKAKSLFLSFTNDDILETTKYGQVIQKNGADSIIYINGVKVAQEDNFLFSYNITLLNSQIKKALNRERTNVGRSAYTSRIKDILLSCDSEDVIEELSNDKQLSLLIAKGKIDTNVLYNVYETVKKYLNDLYPDTIDKVKYKGNTVYFTHNDVLQTVYLSASLYGTADISFVINGNIINGTQKFLEALRNEAIYNKQKWFDDEVVPLLTKGELRNNSRDEKGE